MEVEAFGVSLGETAPSADVSDSKYSIEKFEGRSEKGSM